MVTHSISDYFFTTSEIAGANLTKEGVKPEKIFFVGNTIIDTLLTNLPKATRPNFWDSAGLSKGNYYVLTYIAHPMWMMLINSSS